MVSAILGASGSVGKQRKSERQNLCQQTWTVPSGNFLSMRPITFNLNVLIPQPTTLTPGPNKEHMQLNSTSIAPLKGNMWVVVKVMVPSWVLFIIRHLLLGYPKKGP